MPGRLYLDNAATSFPKPPEVMQAMQDYAARLGASAGRGGYAEALETGELLAACRTAINKLINGQDARQVVFTLNCTDALNLALRGLVDPFDPGHVVCSALDHNSVLRPIHAMAQQWGLAFTIVQADPATSLLDPAAVREAIRAVTRHVVLAHDRNVADAPPPLRESPTLGPELPVPVVLDA